MNDKQRRFAEEYNVDHNATAAAIRAGYAEKAAKQTGHKLLQKPDVRQLVEKLDAKKRDGLGLEAEEALAEVQELLRDAKEKQPKIWKGEPVTYVDDDGEIRVVTEFRSGTVAARMAELLWKKAGYDVSKHQMEHSYEVYTLHLDRDLSAEGEE
jgi:phage terminase small subunit